MASMLRHRSGGGRWGWLVGATLLAGACAKPVLPEASAPEHEVAARQHLLAAARDRQLYNPQARQPRTTVLGPTPIATPEVDRSVNPTREYLERAKREREHAREHEAAAAEIRAFESIECAPFAPSTRAACPLLGPIVAVTDIDRGVRLEYGAGTDVESILGLMRCHLAYARAHGFEVTTTCPLYLRGVEIALAPDGNAIEVRCADEDTASLVRVQARALAPEASLP